jgi:hypothetical protein
MLGFRAYEFRNKIVQLLVLLIVILLLLYLRKQKSMVNAHRTEPLKHTQSVVPAVIQHRSRHTRQHYSHKTCYSTSNKRDTRISHIGTAQELLHPVTLTSWVCAQQQNKTCYSTSNKRDTRISHIGTAQELLHPVTLTSWVCAQQQNQFFPHEKTTEFEERFKKEKLRLARGDAPPPYLTKIRNGSVEFIAILLILFKPVQFCSSGLIRNRGNY